MKKNDLMSNSILFIRLIGICIIYAMIEHIDQSYVLMLVFMLVVVALFILLDVVQLIFGSKSGTADGKDNK